MGKLVEGGTVIGWYTAAEELPATVPPPRADTTPGVRDVNCQPSPS